MNIDIVDLDHAAIRVSDLEKSLDFYHELLGMPIRDRDRFEADDVPYVAVAAGGRHIHLVPVAEDEPIEVNGEHLCILIRGSHIDTREELEELLAELASEGVDVESGEPRKRYGAYGRAWAAYVRDPDGRRVELKIH